MSTKEVKITFEAPLNRREWEDDMQKQFNILQLGCLLSYNDMGRNVIKELDAYIGYINSGKCDDPDLSDKREAFCRLMNTIDSLVDYECYPRNLSAVLPDVIYTLKTTLVSNAVAGNEYYVGCSITNFYKNLQGRIIKYGKELNTALNKIINSVYSIPFEVYPDSKYFRKTDAKLAFDETRERIFELYDKTIKDDDEIHDTYVTKTFSIYSSKFQMNIAVKDSSKAEHKTVKTLISQPVVVELDEVKFDDVELDEIVLSTLLSTMFTKSEKALKRLVKDTIIQIETCTLDDNKNVQATKNYIIKNFLQIDEDKDIRVVLYNQLNRKLADNYNLSRLVVKDAMDVDFESVLHNLYEIMMTRYNQLEPIYTTYYRLVEEFGRDSFKIRTTQQGFTENLYIQYIDKERDRNFRIMRMSINIK